MKANNLTISIPASCTKNCPYCISQMTWAPKVDQALFYKNLPVAKMVARQAQVSSVLLTSKGEPLNNRDAVILCLDKFKSYPTELQTNGDLLTENMISELALHSLNTLAISIDYYKSIYKFDYIYEMCNGLGIIPRITIVLTSIWQEFDVDGILKECKELGIKQLTFRKSSVPNILSGPNAEKTAAWIQNHKHTYDNNDISQQEKFLNNIIEKMSESKSLVRNLPFGGGVYDINGIAITIIDYCIQESNNTEDIRSIIHHQDGHGYTDWDKPGSILY